MTQPPPPVIDSRAQWQAGVLWGIGAAIDGGARSLTWVDAGFESWPLDDAGLLRQLTDWVRLPQRRLMMLAADYDAIPRRFPRFTVWRRDFQHAIQALQVPDELAARLPTLMHDDGAVSVQLLDALHWRGLAQRDRALAWRWREQTDAFLQRSSLSFAVHTLGL